jgi:hypothetical protein
VTTTKYQLSVDLSDLRAQALALAETAIASTRMEGARPVDNFARTLLSLAGAIVEVASTGGSTQEAVAVAKEAMDRWIELLEAKVH